MSTQPYNVSSEYQPGATIEPPAIYAWPPKPFAALKYLFVDLVFSWNLVYVFFAYLSWRYLLPDMETMKTLAPGWIASIWLRNAVVLTLVAGGLHWWLYMRRGQTVECKFNRRWMETDNDQFLWGDQVWDNMFWSIASGVTIWTAYEVFALWMFANGNLPTANFVAQPAYIVVCIYAVFFVGTAHFYLIHRLLHWQPLYRISHELHHRNTNVGPWTGISMHPIEHIFYFSIMLAVLVFPMHPFIIVLLSIWFGVGPAPSHSGFDFLKLKRFRFSTGDWYHQLHHQYFDLNYGNTLSPLDQAMGTWHNGSKESLVAHKARVKEARKAARRS